MSRPIPTDLLLNLPDSTLELVSWDHASGTLSLRLRKDLGPETGIVRFSGVSHINLLARMEVAGIEILAIDQLEAHWPVSRDTYDVGASAFLIHESWGSRYFVVAEGIEYVRESSTPTIPAE